MKKTLAYLILIVISISFFGCEEEPVFVKADEVCMPQYKDKKVIIEGELLLPNSFYSTGKYATLVLRSKKGDRLPSVIIYFLKERKNTMERITDGYTMDDIKIYDSEGNNVKLGEKVKLTGKLVGADKTWCELYVDKIEKVK